MARCAHCQKLIVGGVREGPLRFCNEKCHERRFLLAAVALIDPAVMAALVAETHDQPCRLCGGPGPVDVYTAYSVTSFFWLLSWKDDQQLSCHRYGVRRVWRGLVWTGCLGWWSVPFGLVATPRRAVR